MDGDLDQRVRGRVGTVLNDKWTLEELIGVGGMAAVYAARHRNGARAAVKVLHPDYTRHEGVRERFLREGYAANRVEHSGVVKVLDDDVVSSGPDEGAAFLVMELLEGQSIEERIKNGPRVGERELLLVLREVLGVLEAAHAAGVIHRDLKPENLFLLRPAEGDPAGESVRPKVKVLDFGLARVSEGSGTRAGLAMGTPSYMPPEQARGRVDEVDARADLFALAASAFRILAGRTVHPASNAIEIVFRMAKEPAPKLRSVAPAVSIGTAKVIDRALAFDKEDRFPDAAAMRVAVDEALAALTPEPSAAIELSLSGAEVVTIETKPRKVAEPSDDGLDSILQRLDLAPRPLTKRWRIVAVTVLAWGGILVATSLEGTGGPVDAALPPVVTAPSIATGSPDAHPSTTVPRATAKPRGTASSARPTTMVSK